MSSRILVPDGSPGPPEGNVKIWEAGSDVFWTGSEVFWIGLEGFWRGSEVFWTCSEVFWTGLEVFWTGSEVFWTGSEVLWTGSEVLVQRFCGFVAISVQFLHPLGIPFPPLGITFSISLASEAEISVCLGHLVSRSDFRTISDDILGCLGQLKLGFHV